MTKSEAYDIILKEAYAVESPDADPAFALSRVLGTIFGCMARVEAENETD